MQNDSGYEPDMSSARDVIRRSAQQLRQDEARYASPALTFTAAPAGEPELAALKQMDALLLGNAYSDATYTAILDQLQGYLARSRSCAACHWVKPGRRRCCARS